jgi:transposase InsO family protein
VKRAFRAHQVNQLWFTDSTEHPTAEGKLYLCAVKDACSNRIVGYSMSDRMTSALASLCSPTRSRSAGRSAPWSTPTAAAKA